MNAPEWDWKLTWRQFVNSKAYDKPSMGRIPEAIFFQFLLAENTAFCLTCIDFHTFLSSSIWTSEKSRHPAVPYPPVSHPLAPSSHWCLTRKPLVLYLDNSFQRQMVWAQKRVGLVGLGINWDPLSCHKYCLNTNYMSGITLIFMRLAKRKLREPQSPRDSDSRGRDVQTTKYPSQM
jgi:hypothetical protein